MTPAGSIGQLVCGYDRIGLWYDRPLPAEHLWKFRHRRSSSKYYKHVYFHPAARMYILTGRRHQDLPHAMINLNLGAMSAREATTLLTSLGVDMDKLLVGNVEARIDIMPGPGLTLKDLSSCLLVDRIRHVDLKRYEGQTVYFGSRRSNRQVTNYDKALQARLPHPCLRLEVRLKAHRLWKLSFTEFLEQGLPVNPFSGVHLVDTSWLDGRTLEARLLRTNGVMAALRSKALSRYRKQRLRKKLLENVLFDLQAAFEDFTRCWHTGGNGGSAAGNATTARQLPKAAVLPAAPPAELASSQTPFTSMQVTRPACPVATRPELRGWPYKRTFTAPCPATRAATNPTSTRLYATGTPRFARARFELEDELEDPGQALQASRTSFYDGARPRSAHQTPLGRWGVAGVTATQPTDPTAPLAGCRVNALDHASGAPGEKLVSSTTTGLNNGWRLVALSAGPGCTARRFVPP